MFERVLAEMLADRGYRRTPCEDGHPFLHSVWERPDGGRMAVFVLLEGLKTEMVGVKEMRQVRAWLVEQGMAHGLAISKGGVNHYTVKETRGWEDLHIELFKAAELQVNITHSCYYQPHALLAPADRQAVLDRYGADKLPRLQASDPVVRYFGWRVGDVVEVRPTYGGCEFDRVYNIVCHPLQ